MKRLILFACMACTLLVAQSRNKTSKVKFPLIPVAADSVTIEDFFWYGQLQEAQKVCPQLKANPWNVDHRKHLHALSADWQEKVNHLDLTGRVKTETQKDELHSAVDIVKQSAYLALATGQSKYADIMETSLYNGVCGWQNSDNPDNVHLASQTLADMSGYAFATSKEHLFVNLYITSEMHVKNKQLDVKMMTTTSTPWYYQMMFQFLFPRGKEEHMVLHLRMPNWLSNNILPNFKYNHYQLKYSLLLNGIALKPEMKDGYIVLDRVWCDSDILQLLLPTPIRRVTLANNYNEVALQKGPLLYSFISIPENTFIKAIDPIHSEFDKHRHTNTLSSKCYDDSNHVAGTFRAEPYLFNRKNKDARIFVPFKP